MEWRVLQWYYTRVWTGVQVLRKGEAVGWAPGPKVRQKDQDDDF